MGDCARLCLQHYSRAHRENIYCKTGCGGACQRTPTNKGHNQTSPKLMIKWQRPKHTQQLAATPYPPRPSNTYCKPEVAIAALHFTVSLLHYHVKVDNSFSSFALQEQGPQQSAEEAPIMLLETALWAASAADARATFPLLSWLVEALPPANALLNFTRKAIHRLKSKHSGFSTAYPHAAHPIAHNTENHRNNHYPHLQKYKRLL